MAAGKLQKIGCFVNISSEDLQKTDPDPLRPARFHRAAEIEAGQDWLTNKSLPLFLSRFLLPSREVIFNMISF